MGPAIGTTRVLLIDDNDFIRETVAAMLRDLGFPEISQARDGGDALRQLEPANPGLIICDIDMKPMDGLQFVEALRKDEWGEQHRFP